MFSPGSPRPRWLSSPRYSSPSSSSSSSFHTCGCHYCAVGCSKSYCTAQAASRTTRTITEYTDNIYDNISRVVENESHATSRRSRTLSENHFQLCDYSDDDDDLYDNISRIVENESEYQGADGIVIHRVLLYPRPVVLPPDFLPCGQNCSFTSCSCLRKYSV